MDHTPEVVPTCTYFTPCACALINVENISREFGEFLRGSFESLEPYTCIKSSIQSSSTESYMHITYMHLVCVYIYIHIRINTHTRKQKNTHKHRTYYHLVCIQLYTIHRARKAAHGVALHNTHTNTTIDM